MDIRLTFPTNEGWERMGTAELVRSCQVRNPHPESDEDTVRLLASEQMKAPEKVQGKKLRKISFTMRPNDLERSNSVEGAIVNGDHKTGHRHRSANGPLTPIEHASTRLGNGKDPLDGTLTSDRDATITNGDIDTHHTSTISDVINGSDSASEISSFKSPRDASSFESLDNSYSISAHSITSI